MAETQQAKIGGAKMVSVPGVCHHLKMEKPQEYNRIVPGKEPVRFFEMNLKRVGDMSWPAAGAISPK